MALFLVWFAARPSLDNLQCASEGEYSVSIADSGLKAEPTGHQDHSTQDSNSTDGHCQHGHCHHANAMTFGELRETPRVVGFSTSALRLEDSEAPHWSTGGQERPPRA